MKKFLIFGLALFAFLTVNAQYSTSSSGKKWDRFVLGGTINFHYRASPADVNVFSQVSKGYTFNPYVAKVLNDRWLVGLELNIGQSNTQGVAILDSRRVNVIDRRVHVGAELFGRFTVNPKNKLQVYLRPYAGYAYHENHIDRHGFHQYVGKVNLGLDVGLTYQLSKRVNITANIGNLNFAHDILHNESFGFYNNSIDFNIDPSNIKLGAEIKF